MKQNLFYLFILSLTFLGCSTTKTQPSANIMQGISGYVYEAKGNQMPMKGAPKKTPKSLQCTILVYEPTNIADVDPQTATTLYTKIRTKEVALVNTDSTGFFKIQLPIGKYSLFIKQGDQYFANMFDQFNNIALFEVLPATFTEVKLTVNKAAAY
jgi:hypothetical protein